LSCSFAGTIKQSPFLNVYKISVARCMLYDQCTLDSCLIMHTQRQLKCDDLTELVQHSISVWN